MDSKLVEEIEECLADIRDSSTSYLDPAKRDAYIEAEKLLQRCLESLRWKYLPEEPTETGDYLVETENEYGDKGFEIMRYKVSKAFGNKWEFLGSGYTLVRWLHIPQ